jgi:hypothetical protein
MHEQYVQATHRFSKGIDCDDPADLRLAVSG